jgi:hypothetical protein
MIESPGHDGSADIQCPRTATMLINGLPTCDECTAILEKAGLIEGAHALHVGCPIRTYPGFPDGVTDSFLKHAAKTSSQYDITCRALAAEVLAERATVTRFAVEIARAQAIIDLLRVRASKGYHCKHENVSEGPRCPLRYGSAPTQVCDLCGWWRTNLHAPSQWQQPPIPTAADDAPGEKRT